MKQTFLPLVLVLFSATAFGQQPTPSVPPNGVIERVDISGLPEAKLSDGLRADMQKLVGQPYNAEAASVLAEGVQIEQPEYIAAATPRPGSQADRIHLVFVVAKIADNEALKTNINSRYIVDAVEIEGKFKASISDALNGDLQKMVGQNLDSQRVDQLGSRIQVENTSTADVVFVSHRLRRGDTAQHVKVVYDVSLVHNTVSAFVVGSMYHSRQGISFSRFGVKYTRRKLGALTFRGFNDANPLIERDSGIAFDYDYRIRGLLFHLEYSSARVQWKTNTLQAAQQDVSAPGLYRLRDTIAVSTTLIKLPLGLTATGGATFEVLQMQSPVPGFQANRSLRGSISSAYKDSKTTNVGSWSYSIRSAFGPLGSDFIYTRHELTGRYRYRWDSGSTFELSFRGGRVTGNAPMSERFSLGNAQTLRGWNKYELDPLGGNRYAHSTAEYGVDGFGAFYDLGSVWDAGQPAVVRHSTGFRIGGSCKLNKRGRYFCYAPSVTVAFPIRRGGARPALIVEWRF